MGLQALMIFHHFILTLIHRNLKSLFLLVFVDGRINEERADNSLEARPPGCDGYAGSRSLSQQFSVSLATSLTMSFSTSHVRHCRGKIKQTTPIHSYLSHGITCYTNIQHMNFSCRIIFYLMSASFALISVQAVVRPIVIPLH